MKKVLALRSKKELLALFNRYAATSEKQDRSRRQAIVDFVTHVANLPDAEAELQLKAAAVTTIDTAGIATDKIPAQIRVELNIDDEIWNGAIQKFRNVFGIINIQLPYFIRVSGVAYMANIEQRNNKRGVSSSVAGLENFKEMTVDQKLSEIYRLLLESVCIPNNSHVLQQTVQYRDRL